MFVTKTHKALIALASMVIAYPAMAQADVEKCADLPADASEHGEGATKEDCLSTAASVPMVPEMDSDASTVSASLQDEPSVLDAPVAHYWRTAFELGGSIALGTAWYWIDRERQVADWDYPSWSDKLTFADGVMIFDNNPFRVNYTWHTYAGGSSQLAGRSNGLGIYESAGMGLLASVFWEYNIESREKVSINDLLITNTTGIPAGEYFHRLGQYLQQDQEGLGYDIARWTIGALHSGHRYIDKHGPYNGPTLTPNFRWSYGVDFSSVERRDGANAAPDEESSVQHNLSFEGRFVVMDDYDKAGKLERFFGKANVTDFAIRMGEGDGSSTHVTADTLLAGWHTQELPEKGVGGTGHRLTLATSIGYRYHREQFGLWQDRLGGLHMPGAAIAGEINGDNWKLRAEAHGNFDLMGVNSLSWQQFRVEHPDVIGKSILQNSGYYYGIGASARAMAELQVGPVAAGGRLFAGSYQSIEGFDRDQEAVPEDMEVSGEDSYLDMELWLRSKVYRDYYLQFRYGLHKRDGSLEEFEASEELSRTNIELGLSF